MNAGDLVLTCRGLRFRSLIIPCSIGKGGTKADKSEGDGATPVGTHRISGCYYRADRVAPPCRFAVPIGPGDLWSDDPTDPMYNQRVSAPHGYSHETLRRSDPMYDIVLTTDWNELPTIKGKGSAIFVHIWRRPRHATAGCIAMSRTNLVRLCGQIEIGARLIVVP